MDNKRLRDHVLYIQNGDPAVVRVVNIVTNVTEREIVSRPHVHPARTCCFLFSDV